MRKMCRECPFRVDSVPGKLSFQKDRCGTDKTTLSTLFAAAVNDAFKCHMDIEAKKAKFPRGRILTCVGAKAFRKNLNLKSDEDMLSIAEFIDRHSETVHFPDLLKEES